MAGPGKQRYGDPGQRRLYPVATFNSWCAQPLSAVAAALRMTPNQVSLLSLLVSLAGAFMVGLGVWTLMAGGALLIHLGLLLDHADGQVARRRGMGSTWGAYLDMAIDRVVEIAVLLALGAAEWNGPASAAPGLPDPWRPFGPHAFALWCGAAAGVVMLWRFLTAYNDVLYMRSHLLAAQRLPEPGLKPKRLARRPLVPWVFNRDWLLLIWLLGVLAGQVQGTLLLLLALAALSCAEKMVVFRVRHREPEADAARILGKEYH